MRHGGRQKLPPAFFMSNFASSTNGNGKLTVLFETLSRKAASPQQSPSQLGFVFGSRDL